MPTLQEYRHEFALAARQYNEALAANACTAADRASLAAEGVCDTLRDDGTTDLMAVGAFWLSRAQLYATRAVAARLNANQAEATHEG